MKNTLIIFLFIFLLPIYSYGQKIDRLKTNKKVAKFLKKKVNKNYTFKEVFEREKEEDEEDFQDRVKKIDLDNNGFTDLIVDAYPPTIVVLNFGNENYKELRFRNSKTYYDDFPVLDTIVKIENETILIFNTEISEFDDNLYKNIKVKENQEYISYNTQNKDYEWKVGDVKFIVDSLTVKYGEFATYKKNYIAKDKVKEVKFKTTGCFGTCPIFELKITPDGIMEYNGKKFTNYLGEKAVKLDPNEYNNLIGLIEYADLKNLEDFYAVRWTDDQAGILEITYQNETVKKIEDYGLRGAVDLQGIYNLLFKISRDVK